MKKLCLLLVAMSVCAVAYADPNPVPQPSASPTPFKISNELATVKACDAVLRLPYFANFDLRRIYDIQVQDLGRAIKVNLAFGATINQNGYWTEANCTSFAWMNYDGTPAQCDECLGAPLGTGCNCIAAQCNTDHLITFRK